MDLSRDEFLTHINLLRGDIRGVHDRLDDLNGRTRQTEQDIAVLQDRDVRAKDPAARWTGLSGIAAAVATFLWQQFGWGK